MSLILDPDSLRDLFVFSTLSGETLAAIAKVAKAKTYKANQEVLGHQQRDKDVFFLVSGRVRVTHFAASGRKITYQLLDAGEMFGELAAIDGLPRSAGIKAEEPCVLGRIAAEDFDRLLRKHVDLSMATMHRLARLSRALTEKVFEYHTYDVKGRVCSELLRASTVNGEPKSIPLAITREDMASRVGTTSPNVSKINSELRARGILADSLPRVLMVIDFDRLRAFLAECEFK